jgi:hypothetical protein
MFLQDEETFGVVDAFVFFHRIYCFYVFTYCKLFSVEDNGRLIPGNKYLIPAYVFVTPIILWFNTQPLSFAGGEHWGGRGAARRTSGTLRLMGWN